MSEIAIRFLVANLAIAAAVLVVLALRAPVRALFGARLTYAMWLLVPLAGLATLLPPRVEQIVRFASAAPEMRGEWAGPLPREPVIAMDGQDGPYSGPEIAAPIAEHGTTLRETSGFAMPSPALLALTVWIAGVIGMLAWQLRRQSRFVSDAKAGFAGPAVVGVIKPRIVTPSDFETTFDRQEREMILTHERIHIEGSDARINALAALAGCICWFNPLVHLGTYFMRIDQELACDASVVSRHPEAKSLYASALLKAQLARAPLPLGCHWPSRSEHPLLQRVAMLGRAEPARGRRIAGVALLGLLAAASGVAAWAAMPPEQRVVERNMIEAPRTGDAAQDAPAPQLAPGSVMQDRRLRIVALRRALLEIRAPSGTTFVRRFFEPGESYAPRVGDGWTVSAEEGAAFEWRAGDELLGLLAPSGAAKSVPVDGVLPGIQPIKLQVAPQKLGDAPANPNASAPTVSDLQAVRDLRTRLEEADRKLADLQRRYSDQHPDVQRALLERNAADARLRQAMKRIAEPQKIPAGFDPNDPVYLRGTVEKIDFAETTYTAYVRARSVAAGPGAAAKADDHLWKLSPINYWGDRDRVSKDILKEMVDVAGYRTTMKACGPNCEMYASVMIKCTVMATFAPGCVLEPGLQGPVQQLPYQQQTPPPPAEAARRVLGPAGAGPVVIRGKVERIDFTDAKYTLFVRASTASWPGGFADQSDNSLFQLSPTTYWGDRDAVNADLKGKDVVVMGSRTSTSCDPACPVSVVSLKVAQPTALAPIMQTPGFSSADVMVRYDASAAIMIQGVVQRIEFGERAFDAYVQLPANSGVPGALYQVRAEYRFPRADIEKQLKGKTVYIAGWSTKVSMDTTCGSPCGLYATDIRLGTGEIISPAGEQLVTRASGAAPGARRCFKDASSAPSLGVLRCSDDGKAAPVVDVRSFASDDRYDINAPVTLNGRIVRADRTGFWVEVAAFQPANTPGAESGKTWFVESDGPISTPADLVGQRVTFRGFNSKDTSCKPECRMFGLGFEAG